MSIADKKKIFLYHSDFIRTVIFSIVDKIDEADDLFQDFFLFMIRNPFPSVIGNIKSYLYKSLINHLIYNFHRETRYQSCLREYGRSAYHPVMQKTPQESILETDELVKVFELIEEQLPRAEAQAVRLRYVDDLSNKEIAKIMGVRNGTARGYISAGLSGIRRLLSDNETIASDEFSP